MARKAFERMALRQLVGDRDREGICAEAQAVVGEQTRWVCDSFAMASLLLGGIYTAGLCLVACQ
jgi:hypothetical protein